jgi:hypothetical protein
LRPGLPQRQTPDCTRHDATTRLAAFNILRGRVAGACQDRHRGREFVSFLKHLEKNLPADHEVRLHFTPTSSLCLNEVERFFPLITGRMVRRWTFHSADELEWRTDPLRWEGICRCHSRRGQAL